MTPPKHIDPDLLALFAMQLLPPDEQEEISLALQHNPDARRALSQIYTDLSMVALSADMHSPPALARERLMDEVSSQMKIASVDPSTGATVHSFARPGSHQLVSKVLPWTGWALAAGLALLSVTLFERQESLKSTLASNEAQMRQTQASAQLANTLMETLKDESAVQFTLTGSDQKPPPQGRVTYVKNKGSLVMTATNLNQLAPYKTYELWLIPTDNQAPIPAGTFHPDARGFATVLLPELPKGVSAKAFGVTIEDGSGSRSPTMPIVLKGATS